MQPDYAETALPMSEMHSRGTIPDILDARGQMAMRRVCRLARQVLDVVASELRPGVTTDFLDEVCHKACIERNVSATRFRLTLIISNLDSHILLT
jgi:methionyl aminopeptidase